MIRLTGVSGLGLSGATFAHKLELVTAIVGSNFAGKTTVINAILLALAERVPGIATKPGDVFDTFASGQTMTAGVQSTHGSKSATWMRRNDKTSVTRDGDGELAKLEVDPVLIDPNDYLGLSDTERTKYIFNRVTVTQSVETLKRELVADIKNIKLEENTPESESVINDVVRYIDESKADNVQEWLEYLVEWARAKKNLAEANVKRLQNTSAGLTQTASDRTPAPQDAEQRLKNAQSQLEQALAAEQALKQTVDALREKYKEQSKKSETTVNATVLTAQIETLESNLATAKSVAQPPEFSKYPSVYHGENKVRLEALSVEKERLAKLCVVAPKDGQPLADALAKAQEVLRCADADCRAATEALDRIDAAIERAKADGCCAACGQSLAPIKEKRLAELKAEREQAQTTLDSASKTHENALATWLKADADWSNQVVEVEKYNANREAFRVASDQHRQVQDAVRADTLNSWQVEQNQWNAAQKTIHELTTALADTRNKLANANAINDAASEASALAGQIAAQGVEYAEQLKDASATVVTARETVAKAGEQNKALMQERAEAATRARAEAAALTIKVEAVVAKESYSILVAKLREIVEATVKPVLDSANQLCDGILLSPLMFKDGVIGRKAENARGFISHKAFSGAEKALVYCALSIALATTSPLKLVILDEMGRMDADTKKKVINRCKALAESGIIGNAILVDVTDTAYKGVYTILKIS